MQNAIVEILKDKYSHFDIEKGIGGFKQKVDIIGKVKGTGEIHFFEIKTYSAKRSIREALGQILEYAHYPSKEQANKLFIIGPEEPGLDEIAYMSYLRNKYHLPVWFRWYSFAENNLSDEI